MGLMLKCKSSSSPNTRTGTPDKIIKPKKLLEKLSELYHAKVQPNNIAMPPILGVEPIWLLWISFSLNPREEYWRWIFPEIIIKIETRKLPKRALSYPDNNSVIYSICMVLFLV